MTKSRQIAGFATLVAVVAGILPSQIAGDTHGNTVVKTLDSYDGPQRFQLFNRCQPIVPVIAELPEGASIGLSEDALRAAVESRLRSARLYQSDAPLAGAVLYVRVSVSRSRAFVLNVSFMRRLQDATNRSSGLAATWARGIFGVTSRADLILSALSQHLDEFLAEYLRVNESACKQAAASGLLKGVE